MAFGDGTCILRALRNKINFSAVGKGLCKLKRCRRKQTNVKVRKESRCFAEYGLHFQTQLKATLSNRPPPPEVAYFVGFLERGALGVAGKPRGTGQSLLDDVCRSQGRLHYQHCPPLQTRSSLPASSSDARNLQIFPLSACTRLFCSPSSWLVSG